MGLYRYSVKFEGKTGKAQAHDLDASYKDLTQICRTIRGKNVPVALNLLEDAIAQKRAIPYFKFNKGMGHRSELSGRKGRYPKKECRMVKATLLNAQANAVGAGLSKDALYVKHAAAYKQNRFKRYRHHWPSGVTLGYGKQATWADYETAWLELVVAQGGKVPAKNAENRGKSKTESPSKDAKAALKPKAQAHKGPAGTDKAVSNSKESKPESLAKKTVETKVNA